MAQTKLKGDTVNTVGELPKPGSQAPDFTLTKSDLSPVSLSDFKGKKVILNIFPSLDTSVCAESIRTFNKKATEAPNTVVLSVSKDLPFAHGRFCSVEGIENAVPASEYKDDEFGKKYGVRLVDSAMEGLFARAVVVVDEDGKVIYNELVSDIVKEPNYDKAIEAVK
ncbi:MAG: thiol peroxidase [Cyclobacteriaceae bacterium]